MSYDFSHAFTPPHDSEISFYMNRIENKEDFISNPFSEGDEEQKSLENVSNNQPDEKNSDQNILLFSESKDNNNHSSEAGQRPDQLNNENEEQKSKISHISRAKNQGKEKKRKKKEDLKKKKKNCRNRLKQELPNINVNSNSSSQISNKFEWDEKSYAKIIYNILKDEYLIKGFDHIDNPPKESTGTKKENKKEILPEFFLKNLKDKLNEFPLNESDRDFLVILVKRYVHLYSINKASSLSKIFSKENLIELFEPFFQIHLFSNHLTDYLNKNQQASSTINDLLPGIHLKELEDKSAQKIFEENLLNFQKLCDYIMNQETNVFELLNYTKKIKLISKQIRKKISNILKNKGDKDPMAQIKGMIFDEFKEIFQNTLKNEIINILTKDYVKNNSPKPDNKIKVIFIQFFGKILELNNNDICRKIFMKMISTVLLKIILLWKLTDLHLIRCLFFKHFNQPEEIIKNRCLCLLKSLDDLVNEKINKNNKEFEELNLELLGDNKVKNDPKIDNKLLLIFNGLLESCIRFINIYFNILQEESSSKLSKISENLLLDVNSVY